jgi:hypothetical protein
MALQPATGADAKPQMNGRKGADTGNVGIEVQTIDGELPCAGKGEQGFNSGELNSCNTFEAEGL